MARVDLELENFFEFMDVIDMPFDSGKAAHIESRYYDYYITEEQAGKIIEALIRCFPSLREVHRG